MPRDQLSVGWQQRNDFVGWLMNMPQLPRQTPFALHNKALLKTTKAVAVETMTSTAEEIYSLR